MNTPAMIIDFEATDVSKEAEATQLGYRNVYFDHTDEILLAVHSIVLKLEAHIHSKLAHPMNHPQLKYAGVDPLFPALGNAKMDLKFQ